MDILGEKILMKEIIEGRMEAKRGRRNKTT